MPEHLTKDVNATVSAVHTYSQPFGVTIGSGGSLKTALTDRTFNRISNLFPLGFGETTLVTEYAIKNYVDSSYVVNAFGNDVAKSIDVAGQIVVGKEQRHVVVSAYSGTSGTVNTIGGDSAVGMVIIIRPAVGHTIRISANQLAIGVDCVLGNTVDCIVLMKFIASVSGWLEISRSTNYYA